MHFKKSQISNLNLLNKNDKHKDKNNNNLYIENISNLVKNNSYKLNEKIKLDFNCNRINDKSKLDYNNNKNIFKDSKKIVDRYNKK